MLLSMLEVGETAVISKISGNDEIRQHLSELGFVVGESVTVMNRLGGNLIVAVMEGRIALAEDLVMRIHV